jgi:hypothetical protein
MWLVEAACERSSPEGPQMTAWRGERGKGRQAQGLEASTGRRGSLTMIPSA